MYNPVDQIFDNFAASYEETINTRLSAFGSSSWNFTKKKLWILKNIVLKNWPFNEQIHIHILDFGCGIGLFSSLLHSFFPQCLYTGFDPSRDSIRRAKEKFQKENCIFTNDIKQLKQNYSLIVVACVLHHVLTKKSRLDLISFLLSRLVPDGSLVFFEHNPYNPFTCKIVRECVFDKNAVLLSCSELKNLVAEAKGHIVDSGYYGFFPRYSDQSGRIEKILKKIPFGTQYFLSCR